MRSRLSREASSSSEHLLCSAGPVARRDSLSLVWDICWGQFVPSGPVSIPVPDSAGWVGWFVCLLPFCFQHFLESLQDVL